MAASYESNASKYARERERGREREGEGEGEERESSLIPACHSMPQHATQGCVNDIWNLQCLLRHTLRWGAPGYHGNHSSKASGSFLEIFWIVAREVYCRLRLESKRSSRSVNASICTKIFKIFWPDLQKSCCPPVAQVDLVVGIAQNSSRFWPMALMDAPGRFQPRNVPIKGPGHAERMWKLKRNEDKIW